MSTAYTVYKLEPISGAIDTRPYIGVTGDYRMRIHNHRHDYKRFPNRPVYAAMRANGGFEGYRHVIVQQFLESDYEEGVAMRLAADLEAKLVRELIPLKGCLNTEMPGRSSRDWKAQKRATDPDFKAAEKVYISNWRAQKRATDPDFKAAERSRLAAWRAKKRVTAISATVPSELLAG
jgi:hypothetical protein